MSQDVAAPPVTPDALVDSQPPEAFEFEDPLPPDAFVFDGATQDPATSGGSPGGSRRGWGAVVLALLALGFTGGVILFILTTASGAFGMSLPGGCGGG
jgi:hypothetical protein